MREKGKEYSSIYQDIKSIGRGNFGTVYLVKNLAENKLYVAKKIPLDALSEKEIESTISEAQLLKNLDNPNIVAYKNSFSEKGTLIIVMEYCDQGDLATQIKLRKEAKKPFTEAEIMHWFVQICLAMQYIHSKRILHRDLKTSNIFITGNNCLKIGDFGISKVLQGTLEAAMTVVGTPYYMSPEICQSKPYTLKSDIWALGCLLYELCTLEHPFHADNLLSLVYKIVQEQYDMIPSIYSQDLINLITTMLLKDADKRPTTSEILGFDFVMKYVAAVLKTNGSDFKDGRTFERQATATVHMQIASKSTGFKKEPEEKKILTAKEKMLLKKEEETQRQMKTMAEAAKGAHQQMAQTKSRKQQDLFTDHVSPGGRKKAGYAPQPASPLHMDLKPAPIEEERKSPNPELTLTTNDLNDRSGTIELEESMGTITKSAPAFSSDSRPISKPEAVDTRLITAKGKYDFEAQLDAEQYVPDFEDDETERTKKENEVKTILKLYTEALYRKPEEKGKERETLLQIEKEQMAASPMNQYADLKANCIKALGESLYEKMYSLMKTARIKKMSHQDLQKALLALPGMDKIKLNRAFAIDQIIDKETGVKY